MHVIFFIDNFHGLVGNKKLQYVNYLYTVLTSCKRKDNTKTR